MPKVRILWSLLAVASLCLFSSCSKSGPIDDDPETPPIVDPDPGAAVDYTAFRQSVAKCVADNDYCQSFSVSGSDFRLRTLSNQTITVAKGDVPYVTINADGKWVIDGSATSIDADYPAVSHKSPAVTVSGSGNLVISGKDMGVKAGKSALRCVINARKHVYFGFTSGVYSLGSEAYGMYNPELPEDAEQLNVLFIGNSFTVDATQHLPAMLTAAGVKNMYMTRLYHGGYTLPEYYSNFSVANVCARYDAAPGATSWSGNSTLDDKPADALKARVWDVVVIQEHTGRSEAWSWPGVLKPAVEGLVDVIHQAQPKHRPTIIYLMSQTYSTNSTVLATYFSNDRSKMFATTSGVVQKLMGETGIDMVISTGCALENLRTTKVNVKNGMELTRDSYHMDYGIGRYVAACAVFETIVTPCTGKRTADSTYRNADSSTVSGEYRTAITD
ncbi:MAG: DUF4886 domain-containing protein, partial [Muribaculaceae bacterium]|nr:DUF4886 domain-containing protein [Muribaculaceae bacterium]